MPYKLIAASLVIAPVIVYTLMNCFRRHVDFKGQHIFITGGSQGIGLSLAQLFLLKGANVTIVARTKSKLDEVVRQLDSTKETQRLTGRIQAIAADVTSLQQVSDAVEQAEAQLGPVEVSICCAGFANTGRFVEQDISLFEQSMQLIYFGSLHVAKATLPAMVSRRKGQILFVVSPLAALGFVGYSTYCPAKYAVRGLADVLRNELVGTGVKISLGYPLDTDTPGFANENLTKPPETEAITRFAGGDVYSPEKIASSLIRGLEREEYHIRTPEFIVNLLISSVSNITPRSYPLIVEMFLAPLVVGLLDVYRRILDSFVSKERRKAQT